MAKEIGEKSNLLNTAELREYYSNTPLLFRNLALIATCNVGWSIALGITSPLMLLRLLDVGVSEGYQATVGSVNLALLSFLVMYFSWKSDHTVSKIGRRKPFLFLAAGPIILSTALFPLVASPVPLVGLWLMKILFGNIKASTFPLLSIDCVRRDMLARGQSILQVVNGAVMFLAMRSAASLVDIGESVPFAFGAIVLCISTIAAWFIKEPPISNPAQGPFKPWSALQVGMKDRRIIWLMLGVSMTASFESIFMSWNWIYAKTNLNLERADIFESLSWAQLVSLAVAFPTGWLIDKVGGFKVIVIYYALMLINFIFLLKVHDAGSLAIYFSVMIIANPLNNAADIMVYKAADPKDVGSFTSSNAFIRNLYNGTLLLFSGWFIEITNRNYHALFFIGVILMTFGMIMFLIYRAKMRSSTHASQSR